MIGSVNSAPRFGRRSSSEGPLARPARTGGSQNPGMARHPLLAPIAAIAALAIGLTACGDDDGNGSDGAPARVIEITANEYDFEAPAGISIAAGDTITFRVTNVGELNHELQVVTGENRVLGKTIEITPGDTDDVTVTFEEAGVYQVYCDIDDHFSRGQRASITVE